MLSADSGLISKVALGPMTNATFGFSESLGQSPSQGVTTNLAELCMLLWS